jgi:hypothetical protein
VHFSILPVADEFVAIEPLPFTVAISLAEFEVALVKGSIRIRLTALSLHRVVGPLTLVERAVRPALLAVPNLDPTDELTLVKAAVAVLQLAVAVLNILAEVSGVDGVVGRDLAAKAVLLALLPPALVERTVRLFQRAKTLEQLCVSVDLAAVMAPLLRLQTNFEDEVFADVGRPMRLEVERRQLLDLIVDGRLLRELRQRARLHFAILDFLIRFTALIFDLLFDCGNGYFRSNSRLLLQRSQFFRLL